MVTKILARDSVTGQSQLITAPQAAAVSGFAPVSVTGNYTANPFERLSYDPTTGPYTINMPASPPAGTIVQLVGFGGLSNAGSDLARVTISGNGHPFGFTTTPSTFDLTSAESLELFYTGVSWEIQQCSFDICIEALTFISAVGAGVQIVSGGATQLSLATAGLGNQKFTGINLSPSTGSDYGYVQRSGIVAVAAAYRVGAWDAGQRVYLHPTTAGTLTTVMPTTSGQYIVPVGWTTRFNTTGMMFIDRGEPSLIP